MARFDAAHILTAIDDMLQSEAFGLGKLVISAISGNEAAGHRLPSRSNPNVAEVRWTPDPAVERLFANWPARVRADRAARLGLAPDQDFDSIIALHRAETARS